MKNSAEIKEKITIWLDEAQRMRLKEVVDQITTDRHGDPPDITAIIKAIVFGEKPGMVSLSARAYLAGDAPELIREGQHGPFRPRTAAPGRDRIEVIPKAKKQLLGH